MTHKTRTPEEKARRLMELVPLEYKFAIAWFGDEEVDTDDWGYADRRRIIDAYLLIKDDLDLSPLYLALREENDV